MTKAESCELYPVEGILLVIVGERLLGQEESKQVL